MRFSALIPLALAVLLSLGSLYSANATALRTAHVGDRIAMLTIGMVKTQGNVVTVCGVYGVKAFYTLPSRPKGEEMASVVVMEVDGRARAAVTFDEQSLDNSVALYVADAGGVIRYTAPVDDDHPIDESRVCPILTAKSI